MSTHHTARCPGCEENISFKRFLMLNNFSAVNCEHCNTRIGISNRNANAIMAGISGCLSAACIVLCTYYGQILFQSFMGGLATGVGLAITILACMCAYAYRHAELNVEHRYGSLKRIEKVTSEIRNQKSEMLIGS